MYGIYESFFMIQILSNICKRKSANIKLYIFSYYICPC